MTVKEEGKDKDKKKGKDDKKGKEAKKGLKVNKKKAGSLESSNSGDLYFSVPKILNKLLYGLD